MTEVFYESWNERRFRNDQIDAGVTAAEAEAIQFRQDTPLSRGVPGPISNSRRNLRANWCAAVWAQFLMWR